MKIVCVGGGPAGLYLGILLKKANPARDVRVVERNRPDDTFGFGVVFSDATLGNLAAADPESYRAITENFARWDHIDTHIDGRVLRSSGHGFCGLSRQRLLLILQDRCRELGVELSFETEVADLASLGEVDLIVAADGVGSQIRERYRDAFEPRVDKRPNRFVWLGTTFPFEAFTFYFKQNHHGLFRVHAYRYQDDGSTFIVECTYDTWRDSGLKEASEDETIEYLEKLFAEELDGHRLIKNRSIWRQFPTVHNEIWHHENIVLVGDAAHTAHFSIGSGTKLAMEDCIALARAIAEAEAEGSDIQQALVRYEAARRPEVEKLQRAAQVSLEWFENTERYLSLPPEQFTFSLLTRSLRVNHENLGVRDPALVAEIDRYFFKHALHKVVGRSSELADDAEIPPPMFAPWQARNLILDNRMVACCAPLECADDGAVDDFHLVHMGALALGGAALVMTESVAASAEGRYHRGSPGMYDGTCAAGFAPIVDFIHTRTSAHVGLLLGHAGRRAFTEDGDGSILAASPVPYRDGDPVPRALGPGDMTRVRDAFVHAAGLADRAGFDLLSIDMSGGGLLAGFLSRRSNRRKDDFGGSMTSRLRFPMQIVSAVRAAWPATKPMGVRISATDWPADGRNRRDIAEAVAVARALAEIGCDYIAVTTGGNLADERPQVSRLYQTRLCERVRNEANVATMALDDIVGHGDINAILAAGRADLCAPTRALHYDTNYVRHAAQALGHALTWPEGLGFVDGFKPR